MHVQLPLILKCYHQTFDPIHPRSHDSSCKAGPCMIMQEDTNIPNWGDPRLHGVCAINVGDLAWSCWPLEGTLLPHQNMESNLYNTHYFREKWHQSCFRLKSAISSISGHHLHHTTRLLTCLTEQPLLSNQLLDMILAWLNSHCCIKNVYHQHLTTAWQHWHQCNACTDVLLISLGWGYSSNSIECNKSVSMFDWTHLPYHWSSFALQLVTIPDINVTDLACST